MRKTLLAGIAFLASVCAAQAQTAPASTAPGYSVTCLPLVPGASQAITTTFGPGRSVTMTLRDSEANLVRRTNYRNGPDGIILVSPEPGLTLGFIIGSNTGLFMARTAQHHFDLPMNCIGGRR